MNVKLNNESLLATLDTKSCIVLVAELAEQTVITALENGPEDSPLKDVSKENLDYVFESISLDTIRRCYNI